MVGKWDFKIFVHFKDFIILVCVCVCVCVCVLEINE